MSAAQERGAVSEALAAANDNYRLLRVASEKFGSTPTALSPEQHRQLQIVAGREFQIEQAVLASAEARQVVVPGAEIDNAFASIRDRYEDEDSFLETMAGFGVTPESLWQSLARELRVQAVMDLVGSRVKVPDNTDVHLFYYMHPEQFEQPETRTARHILITLNEDYAENTRASAEQRLQLIKKRLLQKPQRFAEQAMKHSECPTALQGGLLGQVPREMLYPQLDACLFALREGSLSDIVESPVGLHLLLCEQIHPARTLSLDEVMPSLREKMHERQRQRQQKVWLQALLQR